MVMGFVRVGGGQASAASPVAPTTPSAFVSDVGLLESRSPNARYSPATSPATVASTTTERLNPVSGDRRARLRPAGRRAGLRSRRARSPESSTSFVPVDD